MLYFDYTRLFNDSTPKEKIIEATPEIANLVYDLKRLDELKKQLLSKVEAIKSKIMNYTNSKNGGQYSKTVIFNRSYSINFRIHSASSKVESSLKFDVNAIDLPVNEVYQQTFDIA